MDFRYQLSDRFTRPGGIKLRCLLLLLALIAPSLQAEVPQDGDPQNCVVPSASSWSIPNIGTEPVRIGVEFFLLDLVEINDKLNSFTLDFVMTLSWHDGRLAGVASQGTGCITRLDAIWHPAFIFLNAGESSSDHTGSVELLENGEVIHSRRYTRTFSTALDMRRFPFDKQTLVVRIASMIYGPDQVEFYGEAALTTMYDEASLPGWSLESLQSNMRVGPITAATTSHSSLEYKILVERQSAYYFWRLVFPLLLLMLMAWSVFWIPPEHLGPQISVAIGAIFSLMSFLVSQGRILPPISYMTTADILIVISVLLIFIAFGESVVTGRLAQTGNNHLAQRIDHIGRWIYILVVFLLAGWITFLTAS